MDYSDNIEAYLRNTLSPQDRKDFESALAADESLRKEVEQYRTGLAAVELLVEADLRKKMKNWEQEDQNTGGGRITGFRFRRLAIAATLLLLLAAAWWVLNPLAKRTPSELAAHYFIPDDSGLRGDAAPDSLQQIIHIFEQGNCDAALQMLSVIQISDAARPQMDFYKGQCLYQQNDTEGAIAAFAKAASPESAWRDLAEWDLLITYLRAGQQGRFNALLNKILKDQQHTYHNKAEALKKEI